MKALDTNLPAASRRGPMRMDTQDGPWSVSVAENPYDPNSYSLYIKTPTHNLTLTRTAMELVELDMKLRHSHPNIKIPTLPLNVEALPAPPKRKSTFLTTLSRLASPTSSKAHRQASGTKRQPASGLPTPLTTPGQEIGDPFTSFSSSTDNSPTDGSASRSNLSSSVTSTTNNNTASSSSAAIAAYLTTLSNTPALRMDRLWKRFVRVRTDDLESVRVERAIKRVRSDLAAHVSGGIPGSKEKENQMSAASSAAPSVAGSIYEKEEHERKQLTSHQEVHGEEEAHEASASEEKIAEEEGEAGHPSKSANATDETTTTSRAMEGVEAAPTEEENENEAEQIAINETQTPVATDPAMGSNNRIHRSQSLDPDKSHRLSRVYTTSVPSQSGAESQTGDESSSSALDGRSKRRRKKRSTSGAGTPKDKEPRKSLRKVVIDDFEMMRVLGKGCAGKVLLVRHKMTQDLFALKAITKRHVLAHQELQHTLTEQAVLKRMAAESRDPFVVKLWWSFHDKENLFLVMDFHPGGDLATQLARWGRLGRDRARFYAAEIVEGVEGLHAAGVIYRDLKPENILIGADGHIVLTDFGLSKEFPRRHTAAARGTEFYSSVPGTPQPATPPWMKPDRNGDLAFGWPGQPIGHTDSTTTFCGTAEYLAPEVIQGLPYSYEVDWWSFGTMLYEMLTGITPFWANNHSDMYVRVLQDELQFPDDRAIDQDTKSLIRGLLQRVPSLRICEPRIKKHPYFSMIDWTHVYYKRYIPPYIPPIDPSNASDTQNFDETFLDMEPVLDEFNENEATDTDQEPQTDADGEETSTTPSQSRSSSVRPLARQPLPQDDDVDVFDGYSFKGRHSVLIDDEDEEEVSGSDEVSEESVNEEEEAMSILQGLEETAGQLEGTLRPEESLQDEGPEPKTPEARPAALPPVSGTLPAIPEAVPAAPTSAQDTGITEEPKAESEVEDVKPSAPADSTAAVPADANGEPVATAPVPPPKPTVPRQVVNNRTTRGRREKSGVPALDRYLSDAVDEDTEATEAEREEEDDWDFVEAADGEDRNGAKGTSLFARGVVDRYRLAVFRKASTPNARAGQRSASGMSTVSGTSETDSPSPTQRRGRTAGLPFRKQTRQFLRPKSPPPSSFNSKSARSLSSQAPSTVNTLGAASGLLSPSISGGSTFGVSHSLKSKESALSMGALSQSSDQSNGQSAVLVEAPDSLKGSPNGLDAKYKTKKLRKYKNNAEKVLALFSSPRQQST
ncbi:hypothetical protein BDN70DRAFT_23355 [Pholiota conissans]|uniref:non-specific serine/threonine protein kinase n=1 Tax=Pholiota conissans TaxID=109636 RepID=A0A9P5ZFP0_9AGAR|nr:hypothetical protein BDN70DRAFT_23355 [Pholiota conissans]